jgi:hypothetical protein
MSGAAYHNRNRFKPEHLSNNAKDPTEDSRHCSTATLVPKYRSIEEDNGEPVNNE